MKRTSVDPGIALGLSAFVLWGLLPLYFKLLTAVPAPQVLAHRVIWSLLLLIGAAAVLRRLPAIRAAMTWRTLAMLSVSAALIAVNWLTYIWAIQTGHVLEASLGYFINPLINVALGVAVLGERLRRVQGIAIGLAAAGVLVLASGGVAQLWLPLTLALSFGVYGLIRKTVAIDALGGLLIETTLLTPVALAVLAYAHAGGQGAFGRDTELDGLLILSGALTAAPLLLFAAAARRLRYATLGLLQYVGPSLSFALAVLVFGEELRTAHVLTFALIWAGCGLYAWDSVREAKEPLAA
jgi:chloramphenicol-sensitive protein RarD